MSDLSSKKTTNFAEEADRLKQLVEKLKKSHQGLVESTRRKDEEARVDFSGRMAELILISNQLSLTSDLDDMCKTAVELGRESLGFIRLGIWLIDWETQGMTRGTFGTDGEGNTRDERDLRLEIEKQNLLTSAKGELLPGILFFDNASIQDINGTEIVDGCQRIFCAISDGKKIIGHLSSDNFPTGKPYTEEDKEIFGFYASVLGPLISNRIAREQLASRNEHLSILNEVGRMVAGSISPKEISEKLLDIIRRRVPCDAFFLSRYDSFTNSLEAICAYDTIDGILKSFPTQRTYYSPSGVISKVIHEREPVIVHREDPEEESKEFTRAGDLDRPSASLLFVPMIAANEIIGFLSVQSYTAKAYNKDYAELLRQVANQTAPALESSILNQTIRERARVESQLNEKLLKLVQVTNELAGQKTLEDLSQRALVLAQRSLQFDKCRIILFSGEKLDYLQGYWSIEESGCLIDERRRRFTVDPNNLLDQVAKNQYPTTLTKELAAPESVEMMPVKMVSSIWDGVSVIGAVEGLCHVRNDFMKMNQTEILRLFTSSFGFLYSLKQSEQARERSEQIYREVIEKSSGVPYRLRYSDCSYEFVGEGIRDLLGISPEDFTMQVVKEMIKEIMVADESGLEYNDYVEKFKSGEIPQYQVDILVESSAGEEKWLHDSAILVRNENGESIGTLGIMKDISYRKRQEIQIRQAHDIYCRAIARAQGVPYRLDLETMQYDFVGEGCLDLVGVPVDELSHEAFAKIILAESPTDSSTFGTLKEMRAAFRRGDIDSYRADMFIRTFAGEEKWISDISVGIRDEKSGEMVATLGILQNITDRKQVQMELEKYAADLARSNAELEHFAYIASHDLREPLRKIASFTELLAKKYSGQLDEAAEKYIWYIVDGANRMHSLIDDLLTYSRLGRTELVKSEISLDIVLDNTLADLEQLIERSGTTIERKSMPVISGNSAQIGQVFQNLLANAIKFCDRDNPSVIIIAQELEKEWCISVQDNGIGIEEQYMDRIFKVFQRLHPIGKYPGTGIGLAICKKIIERHGGRIWVRSEPGEGSKFYFTIPKVREE